MNFLYRHFITGLIVIVPIAITAFVIINILNITENMLGYYLPIKFPGIGLLTVLCLIVVIGWLSSYLILRRIFEFGERILNKIPLVKFIYNSVKKLSTAMFDSKKIFNQAVLIPYPHSEVKTLGFVMSELSKPLTEVLSEEYICVFVPWSINMTSGSNVFVKKSDVIYLNVSSETAIQYFLTAGVVMPKATEKNK